MVTLYGDDYGRFINHYFCKLMQADLTIKCLILFRQQFQKRLRQFYQRTIALYVVAIINFTVSKLSGGQLLIDLIQNISRNRSLLSQGLGAVLIVTVFVQIFWFFGIHGPNVLAPVLEGIWGQAQLINIDIFKKVMKEKQEQPRF